MVTGQIVTFKIGEAFPADDQLARWMTVCSMALNDLLMVNRWLLPRFEEEVHAEPGAIFYLGRLAASHLFEVATFLRKSDRSVEVVPRFVATLPEEPRAAYRELLEIGDGGRGKFQEQLKHARNKSFHYDALLTGLAEERERLRQAMSDHAEHEVEEGIAQGRIEDRPPTITGFRATFADDIAVEMMLPKGADDDLGPFLKATSEHITKFLILVKAALNAYTGTRPPGTWTIEAVGES